MRWIWVAIPALLVAGVVGVLVATGSDDTRGGAARAVGPLRVGAVHRAVEIEGREGGEGDREGATTPSAEQVANRAYPRNYVDDRRARRPSRRAFDATPPPARRARRSARSSAFQRAAAAAPGAWTSLGPVTPNVSGEASPVLRPRHAARAGDPGVRPRDRAGDRPDCGKLRPATAGCGSPPPAAASGARTTRWPRSPPGSRRRTTCRRTLRLALLRRRATEHALRRLRRAERLG